jgi:hypothetical protein
MKSIVPGAVQATPPAKWWAGLKLACPRCHGQVALDSSDDVTGLATVHAERHPGGKQWVEVNCPTEGCLQRLTAEKITAAVGEATLPQPPTA